MSQEPAIFESLRKSAVIAVLVIDSVDSAEPLASALLQGGVDAMELTLRTPVALDALRVIRERVPDMLAGIGTILTPDQVQQVIDAGGSFGVSPGMTPRVVEAAIAAGLPFAPGVATPSDIERALEYDRTLLKFFPAGPSGGLPYLESIAAPYQHLGLRYVPLGGVSEANCDEYLKNPLISAVGGSWLAPRNLINDGNWQAITDRARAAIAIRDTIRSQ
ncbi:MAG: bifunctional 4-hydroxy-2-oxoglutarate aldolase/2-dehydro-3-deoxy-phosphogluconate aldolase [Verrucomicrobiae bacterium]|nr:bifunctional 4-hydroxy-2-oxoglutarate aldolase/2-dehydro-3-deoxy-phosphogluconate aldolase [Verrucomicrobiae bacterium]